MRKYFPQQLTPTILENYKPYILAIILDPRLKFIHFRKHGLLYHYPTIEKDAIDIIMEEYSK